MIQMWQANCCAAIEIKVVEPSKKKHAMTDTKRKKRKRKKCLNRNVSLEMHI